MGVAILAAVGKGKSKGKRRGNPTGPDGKKLKCHSCGSEDHLLRECPNKTNINQAAVAGVKPSVKTEVLQQQQHIPQAGLSEVSFENELAQLLGTHNVSGASNNGFLQAFPVGHGSGELPAVPDSPAASAGPAFQGEPEGHQVVTAPQNQAVVENSNPYPF